MPQRRLRKQQSPDLPDVVIHMTRRWGTPSADVPDAIAKLDAVQRLASILVAHTIRWSTPFDTTWPVASFTQTTRRALRSLSTRYDLVGVAFDKQLVWDAGGGPVYYIRGGEEWGAWKALAMPESMRSRGVRLWPGWDGLPTLEAFFSGEDRGPSEWLHEREWRIPKPSEGAEDGWNFGSAVQFLVLQGPWQRDQLLYQVAALKGDCGWVESLPVAHLSADGAVLIGAEHLWV